MTCWVGIESYLRANKTDDKSHLQLHRIKRVETHCKWTSPDNIKGWVPGDSLRSCCVGVIQRRAHGRAIDQIERPQEGGGGSRASV